MPKSSRGGKKRKRTGDAQEQNTEQQVVSTLRRTMPHLDQDVARFLYDVADSTVRRKKPAAGPSSQGSLERKSVIQEVLSIIQKIVKEEDIAIREATRHALDNIHVTIIFKDDWTALKKESPPEFGFTDIGPWSLPSPVPFRPFFLSEVLVYGIPRVASQRELPEPRKPTRFSLFHGTSLKEFLNMMKTGIQPIGGRMMEQGFYLSADPNVTKLYASNKSYSDSSPRLLLEFTIARRNAEKLRGIDYFKKAKVQSNIAWPKSEKVEGANDFYRNTDYRDNDFVFPSAESISRLHLSRVFVWGPVADPEEVENTIRNAIWSMHDRGYVTSQSQSQRQGKKRA